jgi:hypothetical protein
MFILTSSSFNFIAGRRRTASSKCSARGVPAVGAAERAPQLPAKREKIARWLQGCLSPGHISDDGP